jgi:RNA polymerase sigma-70 factor (ECF subfamily)
VTSDERLIEDMRRGSRAAFATLFERYRQPVWQFFRRRTPQAEVAEELAQDTFLSILERPEGFEQRGTFRSYLFSTAYHVLLAHRRKAALRATDPLDVDPVDGRTADPESGIWVREALANLDEEDREILMLREYEQLSYQEIADIRCTPVNTVRSRLFRARAALRLALESRTPYALRSTHGGH